METEETQDILRYNEQAMFDRFDHETADSLLAIKEVYDPALGALVMIDDLHDELGSSFGLHTLAELSTFRASLERLLPLLEEEAERVMDEK